MLLKKRTIKDKEDQVRHIKKNKIQISQIITDYCDTKNKIIRILSISDRLVIRAKRVAALNP